MEVFCCFAHMQAALERCASLLAPGGEVIVRVDFHLENPESHDWSQQLGVPMQLWSQADYRAGFEKAGLCEVEQHLLGECGVLAEAEPCATLCMRGRLPRG